MFWRRGYTLRGDVGGGWALEFPSFLGPVKWHRADRRVPFQHSVSVSPGKFLILIILWNYNQEFIKANEGRPIRLFHILK